MPHHPQVAGLSRRPSSLSTPSPARPPSARKWLQRASGPLSFDVQVDRAARRALRVAAVRTTGSVAADYRSGVSGRICQVGAGQVRVDHCGARQVRMAQVSAFRQVGVGQVRAVQAGTGQRGAAQGYRPSAAPLPSTSKLPPHSSHARTQHTVSARRIRAGTAPQVPSLIRYGPCIASTSQDRPPSW